MLVNLALKLEAKNTSSTGEMAKLRIGSFVTIQEIDLETKLFLWELVNAKIYSVNLLPKNSASNPWAHVNDAACCYGRCAFRKCSA